MDFEIRLNQIIRTIARKEEAELNDATILTKDLGFDSIKIIEFIVTLEEEFDIEIDDNDMDVDLITQYKCIKEMLREKIKNNKV